MINNFDEKTVRKLLLRAAMCSKPVATELVAQRDAILEAESTQVIDFDRYSEEVWHQLQRGKGQRSSRQFELGLEASVTVVDIIKTIRQQTPAHSSFGTKKSALETLRKIGKSLVLQEYTSFRREVMKAMQEGDPLGTAMLGIVDEMSEEEADEMCGEEEWIDKVKELIELADGYCLYERLNDVLGSLGLVERGKISETVDC